MILSALALLCFGGTTAVQASTVGAAGPVVDTATSCADVTHRWGGDVVLDGSSPSYDTGVEVPAGDGATLTVVGVSADGLDDAGTAHPLDVHVGGMRAAAGVAISGGHVVVSSTSPTPRRVVGVTVVVRRCAVVASAAPAPIAPIANPAATTAVPIATPSSAVNASSSASPAASSAAPPARSPAAASGVTASPMLPETGADEWRQSLVGALVIAAGATLVSFGRRRPSIG